jgi:hypothetical protein
VNKCFIETWLNTPVTRFALVEARCTFTFASPAGLQSVCGDILAWKASAHVVLTKYCQVSFYNSLHQFTLRKLSTPLLHLFKLGARLFDHKFYFLYCGSQKAHLGHFCHIQGQTLGQQFLLYPTTLSCHSPR